ncbi:YihY family inner membrane protein [Limibacillus sp. MBR-115]|jgi:membrane protein|uniref:YihY family inner membrane protein n=1 Tax=Limibacillus sp. MBR-115 TaxID=3156465 RepID=UPI00339AFB89
MTLETGNDPQSVGRLTKIVRSKPGTSLQGFWSFLSFVFKRFLGDDGPGLAASLSYTSLLAIVPLVAIGLAMLAAFPAFEETRAAIELAIIDTFPADQQGDVSARLVEFVDNARTMTGTGIAALAVTAVLLLMRIHTALNMIWRVTEPRPIIIRLLIYWAMLTIGPILIGLSITISGYLFTMMHMSGAEAFGIGTLGLSRMVAIILNAMAFTLLFVVLPNRSIRWLHGLAGASVAACLFEAMKLAFAAYIEAFPSYQVIYGALAAIPIFLLWMYFVWVVVLLGAEVAAALGEWGAVSSRAGRLIAAADRLPLALSLLVRLQEASKKGRALKVQVWSRGLPVLPGELDDVIGRLRKSGYVERTSRGRWLLSRDLRSATLGDLTKTLGLTHDTYPQWEPAAVSLVARQSSAVRAVEDTPLIEVLEACPQADVGRGEADERSDAKIAGAAE